MKKHYFSIGLVLSGILLFSSFSNNPPNGRTGAPGDGLCTDCHTPANPPQDGSIVIEDFPSEIISNETYTLTVVVSNPNGLAELAGFQMTILDAAGNGFGTMTNPANSSTITDFNGRQYFEHNPAVSINGKAIWTVDWTAPESEDGSVALYYAAGNLANGASGNSGDLIVTKTGEGTFGMASSNSNLRTNAVKVFPNPVSDLLNMVLSDQSVIHQVNVTSISGQRLLSVESTNNQINVSELQSGMYILEVETSTGHYLTKMIKR